MILNRRAVMGQMGASALLSSAAFVSQRGTAKPAVPAQPALRRHVSPPRVYTTSTITSKPVVHHKPAHPHLHKHHKHRHHHRKHQGPHNLRALHTLNTPGDRHDLALTMWGEARGSVKKHGPDAMLAIGCVILNRVKWDHHATGHGVHGVCHKRKQFSCWNKMESGYQAMLDLVKQDDDSPDWQMWVLANQLAGKLLAGAYKDITGGSIYYFNADIISPYWLDDMTVVGVMYDHTFCKPAPHHPHHKHHRKHHHHGKSTHQNH